MSNKYYNITNSIVLPILAYLVIYQLFILFYQYLNLPINSIFKKFIFDITLFLIIYYTIRGSNTPIQKMGLKSNNWAASMALGFVLYGCTIPIMYFAAMANRYFMLSFQQKIHSVSLPATSSTSLTEAFSYIFYVVTITPFIQEFVFRGVIFARMKHKWGVYPGIIFSSLIFSLLHFNAQWFLSYCILGILLAYLYHKTDTLLAPIAAHALNNATAIILHTYF